MSKYVCDVCGWVYDPIKGDPKNDVLVGTDFISIRQGWTCPECGAATSEFSAVQ